MSRIAILAGNLQEFKDFKNVAIRCGSLSTFHFINGYNCRGQNFDSYMITGTFWNKKDARRIFEEIKFCIKRYYDIEDLVHEN